MSNSFAKKLFAVGSTVAMLATGFAPFAAHAAAHAVGTNVKSSDGTIWMIMPDGTRRAYTSAGAFLSYGFNSFSSVVDANADDLALAAGSFIPPQDGKIFCATETKGSDVKGECSLVTGGMKAAFTSASVFTGLGFSFSRAQYGDSSFLAKSSNIDNTTAAHRPGVLVNNNGTVQLVGTNGLLGIPDLATFNSWGNSFADVVPANAADKAMTQTGVMAARQPGQLSPTATTSVPTASGSYSAMLASDNPAAGTLVAAQATADLAHFTLNGSGTVTSLKFKRIGVSGDTTLSNVYLFEGSNRLTDAASVSSGYITFAGLNWPVSGSRSFSVKSDILTGTAGQTIGVQLVAVNGTDLSVMPSGNIHTVATATLTTVAIASASGTFTDPGTDITVWQGTVTVGSRDVTFNRLALRQIGSISSADIKNFRLMVDGVQVASVASLDSNGYVTFAPASALKSGSRTVRVMADVVGGSSRTVQLSLRGAYDLSTTDSQYGVNVLATGTFPFGPSASTVASGTLSVVKASNSPSDNVVAGASDVSVGKWTFTAYGETVKVETLTVGIDTNGTDANNSFRNVRVLVDGSQVGSTTSVAAVNSYASGTSFTTNFFVTPGTPRTVEVRSDMYDDTSTDLIGAGTTTSAQFALVAGSSNAVPQVSLTPISVPTASVAANALTIATGSMSLAASPTYPAQTITAPQTAYKIGSFILSGNSSEAININTLTLDMTVTDNSANSITASVADVTDVYIKYGSSQTSVKSTLSATGNTYSISTVLPVNGSMQFDVYGNLGSDISATDTVLSKLLVSGTTALSGQSSSTNSGSTLNGQLLTDAAGSITATADASTPIAALVDDSGTVTSAAFKIAAVTDSYTVTDITLTLGSATAVSTVTLKANGVAVVGGSKPAATSLTYSGLNIPVAANTNVVLTVELTMSPIGVGAGSTDSSLLTTLTAFTARNSAGTSAAGTESDPAGNAMYAYKAIPTVSAVALPTSSLAGGEMVIAKFTVSSGGTGTIAWKQVMLEITKSAAPTLSAATLYNSDTQAQITAASVYQNGTAGVATTCVADNTFCELLITVGTNADDDTVEVVSGAKTYEIRSTIGGTLASGNSVSVKLDRNTTSHAASAAEQTNDNSLAAGNVSFVWSDESASATNDTGVSTWQKDYLVKNTPITWALNRS